MVGNWPDYVERLDQRWPQIDLLAKKRGGTNGIFAGQNAARDQNNTFIQNASMALDLVEGHYIELMVDRQTGSDLDVRAITGLSPFLTVTQVAQSYNLSTQTIEQWR